MAGLCGTFFFLFRQVFLTLEPSMFSSIMIGFSLRIVFFSAICLASRLLEKPGGALLTGFSWMLSPLTVPEGTLRSSPPAIDLL